MVKIYNFQGKVFVGHPAFVQENEGYIRGASKIKKGRGVIDCDSESQNPQKIMRGPLDNNSEIYSILSSEFFFAEYCFSKLPLLQDTESSSPASILPLLDFVKQVTESK